MGFDRSPPLRPWKGVGGTWALAHIYIYLITCVYIYIIYIHALYTHNMSVGRKTSFIANNFPRCVDGGSSGKEPTRGRSCIALLSCSCCPSCLSTLSTSRLKTSSYFIQSDGMIGIWLAFSTFSFSILTCCYNRNGIEHHLHIQRTETAVNLMAPAMLIFMSSMDSCNSEALVSWAWQLMTGRKWKSGHTQKPGSLAVYQNKWSFGNSLASPC